MKEGLHVFLDLIYLQFRPVLLSWFWDCSFPFPPNACFIIQRCRMSSVQQICILNGLSQDIRCSITSTVQSATCKPCKVIFKKHGMPSHEANNTYRNGSVMIFPNRRFDLTLDFKVKIRFSISTLRLHGQTDIIYLKCSNNNLFHQSIGNKLSLDGRISFYNNSSRRFLCDVD